MKTTFFDDVAINGLFKRIDQLKESQNPNWGTMKPVQMMQHCSIVHEGLIKAFPTDSKTSPKQLIARFFVLYVVKKLPKGAKQPKRIQDRMDAEHELEFQQMKERLKLSIQEFSKFKGKIETPHPYFGALSTKEWGRFAYIHLDHHLRQFGV